MTWILMEIPCLHTQIDGSLVQIHTKFHHHTCHLSRFYLFSMMEHDMDFGQVRVMEFPWHLLRKWEEIGSSVGFGLIFEPDQTAVNMA